jgi:holo-[acyl-carrier protein] synthase
MIVGTGVDLLHVVRMEKVWQRHGSRLLTRILHPDELTKLPHTSIAGRWLAKRWAVKEAAAKALGTGFQQSVRFVDFIYEHDALGKPLLRIEGVAKCIAEQRGIVAWHVSVSDEKEYVIAMVIAEKGEN